MFAAPKVATNDELRFAQLETKMGRVQGKVALSVGAGGGIGGAGAEALGREGAAVM